MERLARHLLLLNSGGAGVPGRGELHRAGARIYSTARHGRAGWTTMLAETRDLTSAAADEACDEPFESDLTHSTVCSSMVGGQTLRYGIGRHNARHINRTGAHVASEKTYLGVVKRDDNGTTMKAMITLGRRHSGVCDERSKSSGLLVAGGRLPW